MLLLCDYGLADKILGCNDGDTCRAIIRNQAVKIRLSGIDAPETGQDGAEDSRKFLEKLVNGKDVTLKCSGENDRRSICSLFIGNMDIQKEMVKTGWAFDYPMYSGGKYKAEEVFARKAKAGIWSIKNITSPYCYRYLGVKECNKDKLYQP